MDLHRRMYFWNKAAIQLVPFALQYEMHSLLGICLKKLAQDITVRNAPKLLRFCYVENVPAFYQEEVDKMRPRLLLFIAEGLKGVVAV